MFYTGVITQKMLAQTLGLDRSTVSLALRGDPRIPERTRVRVREAAARQGYSPDPAISALARRRWRRAEKGTGERERICFIRTLTTTPTILADPVRVRAEQLGYDVEIIDPGPLKTPRRLVEVLKARGIRGLVLEQDTEADLFRDWDWSPFSVVQCGMFFRTPVLDVVALDLVSMVNEAVVRLQTAGAEKIGVVLNSHGGNYSDRILEQAVRGHPDGLSLEITASSESAILRAFRRLRTEKVSGIVVLDEQVAQCAAASFRRPVCLATLLRVGPGIREFPGFAWHAPLIGEATVDLLDAKLRSFQNGRSEARRSILILPPWWSQPAESV